ncbi:MAG: hypothetical protein HYS59_02400 [Candidatus Vogelbacteria bacterium]|nr:hypothetical protein [Candidatus Vogelbacteria bacterium]
MHSFVRGKPTHGSVYIFDIGSSSVAAALALTDFHEGTRILEETRAIAPQRKWTDANSQQKKHLEMLREAASAIFRPQDSKPIRIVVFLSSRWHIAKARVASRIMPVPTAVTQALIDSIVDEDLADLERELPQNAAEYLVIDREVMSVDLNGYAVPHPVGMTARSIAVHYFVSIADSRLVRDIEDRIRTHLHAEVDQFYSLTYSLYRSLVQETGARDFLAIRSSSAVTDAFVVRNGVMVASGTIDAGIEKLLSEIADATGLDVPHVRSLISVSGSSAGGASSIERIRKPLEQAGAAYAGLLHELLGQLSSHALLPVTTFLFTEAAFKPLFDIMLAVPQFSLLTLTGSVLDVRGPAHKYLPGLAKIATGDHPDLFLALEASSLLYLEKHMNMI